jgi:hypothetical protein
MRTLIHSIAGSQFRRIAPLAAGVAILSLVPMVARADDMVRVPWEGLSMTVGKTVLVATPKGPMVTGKVTAVEPDALVVQVTRTNDPSARLKGELKVPRATLRVVRMQTKRVLYRVVGTSVGAYLGTAAGAIAATALQSHDVHPAAAIATFIGVGTAATVFGYLAGNEADQRWTTIEILP